MSHQQTWLVAASLLAWPCCALAQPPGPAPLPGDEGPTPERIAGAIRDLGHAKYKVREQASRWLWQAGSVAEPALRKAARSSDPEVANRASAILKKLELGLLPDTPEDVQALIRQYHRASASGRHEVIRQLLAAGRAGCRAAMGLLGRPENASVLAEARTVAYQAARKLAVGDILAGNEGAASLWLAQCAHLLGDRAARDFAALCLVRGTLGVQRRQWAYSDEALAYLYRAEGELVSAEKTARTIGNTGLAKQLAFERGDWVELSQIWLAGRKSARPTAESLGYALAACRLLGRQRDADDVAKRLVGIPQAKGSSRGEAWRAAEALLLNDRPEQAVTVYRRAGLLVQAANIRRAQARYEDALALLATPSSDAATTRLRARDRGFLLCWLGRGEAGREILTKQARQALAALAAPGKGSADDKEYRTRVETLCEMLGAIRRSDLKDLGRRTLAEGMGYARGDSERQQMIRAYWLNWGDCLDWWGYLGRVEGKKTVAERAALLTDLWLARAKPEDVLRWSTASVSDGTEQLPAWRKATRGDSTPPEELRQRVQRIRDELDMLGRICRRTGDPAAARGCMQVAVQLAPAGQRYAAERAWRWQFLGDLYAQEGDWEEARDCYEKARQATPDDPARTWLAGWALRKTGKDFDGRKLCRRASLLALADESARLGIARLMQKYHRDDEARRQRRILVLTAEPGSVWLGTVLRDQPSTLGVAQPEWMLLERSRLTCLAGSRSFVRVGYHLTLTGQVLCARAWHEAQQGRLDRTVALALEAHKLSPASTESGIDLIRALDAAARRTEADRIFQAHWQTRQALCKRWPDSAGLHNQAAWLAGRCRRELDAGLAHALRATRAEPDNHGYLDTLAEVYYARGERAKAIAVMRTCLRLSPEHLWYHQQLRRFIGVDTLSGAS